MTLSVTLSQSLPDMVFLPKSLQTMGHSFQLTYFHHFLNPMALHIRPAVQEIHKVMEKQKELSELLRTF